MSHDESYPEVHSTRQPITTHLADIALVTIREPWVAVEALARPTESHQVRNHAFGIIQATVGDLTKKIVK